MNKKQTYRNVAFSVGEVIVSSFLLFVLYRFVIERSGVASLGVWSLVVASTSVARLGEMGTGGSVVKHVAQYLARGDEKTASLVIQTALLVVGCVVIGLFPIVHLGVAWLLKLVVSESDLDLGRKLLPYAVVSLSINMLVSVVYSGLDGCQRIDLRKLIFGVGNLLYFLSAFVLVRKYGILGLVYSQIVQGFFILLTSWGVLCHLMESLPLIPRRFSSRVLKEIVFYGASFQLTTLLAMFMDPLSKALLSRYGGSDVLGYYEMASKLIVKLKSLIVNANQVLVPVYAEVQEQKPDNISGMYTKNVRLLVFISVPVFLFPVGLAPIISRVWIGELVEPFVWSLVGVSFYWLGATLNFPAYFAYMGIGKLSKNVKGHLIMALVNLAAGLSLGKHFGYKGVLVATCLASFLGTTYITRSFDVYMNLGQFPLLSRPDLVFGGLYLMVAASGGLAFFYVNSDWAGVLSISACFLIICGFSLFKHPVGCKLSGALRSRFQ